MVPSLPPLFHVGTVVADMERASRDFQRLQPLSPYRDFLEANGGDGVHHRAYRVPQIDAYLDTLGEAEEPEVVLDAPLPGGGRFVYVGGAAHGPIVELIETPEA